MDPVERQMQFVFALRSRGITDPAVLTAMEATERDRFLEGIFQDRAYEDTALPIACGQTISQPYVVAAMTEALKVEPPHNVLEIGTGSGYQAAVLAQLAGQVVSVERYRTLAETAERRLRVIDRDGRRIAVDADGRPAGVLEP